MSIDYTQNAVLDPSSVQRLLARRDQISRANYVGTNYSSIFNFARFLAGNQKLAEMLHNKH